MKRLSLVFAAFGVFLIALSARADWTPVKRLTWTSTSSRCPAVAVDSNNFIHVVWYDYAPDNNEIYYRRSTDGGTSWSASRRLTRTSRNSHSPALAMGPGNTIHLVWYDYTPGNNEIYHKRSTDGGVSWGAARRLTWNSGESYHPAIITESGSNVHVTWYDDTPGNFEVYYRRSTDGGTSWGPTKRLTWNSGESCHPALAADSANSIHVVWYDDTPGDEEIYYRRSTDSGTTWKAVQRLTWNASQCYHPAISVDSGDTIHIVWSDSIVTPYPEIYRKKSQDGGTSWSPSNRMTWTSGSSRRPVIAIDAGDVLHVAWDDNASGDLEIYYRKSSDGGGSWSSAQRLTWTSGESSYVAVATDSTNHIYIAWDDNKPGNHEIFFRKGN